MRHLPLNRTVTASAIAAALLAAVPVSAALTHRGASSPAAAPRGGHASHPVRLESLARPASGGFTAGNSRGGAWVPPAARPVSTAHPAHVIGHGTPASCTSRALVAAVAQGGVITFRCGPRPVSILMRATAKIRNTSHRVVLDGGGKVTLSGGGVRRILYLDTCDPAQVWTTSHCQDQQWPHLTVQNIAFTGGNATGQLYDGGGGGAIFARGGQLTVIHARFSGNRCDATGPDLGGAAIRALSEYNGLPVYVSRSTFTGGHCSNGGALSSIGVSWVVLNSVFRGNHAIGRGANPAQPGTPGGGSGGAIYTDGNTYTVTVSGSLITGNTAREGGGALFFVSNDHTGHLTIIRSVLRRNPSAGFFTAGYPGIFYLGAGQHPTVIHSKIS